MRQKEPHHRNAAQSSNAHHADAVHGHDLVEEIGPELQPARLGQAKEQAKHHHQQKHDTGDGKIGRQDLSCEGVDRKSGFRTQ
jgi:hypothetical protein